jgi:hypothetical protein
MLLTLVSLAWCVPAYPKKAEHPLIKIRKQTQTAKPASAQPQPAKQAPKQRARIVQQFRKSVR